MVTIDPEKGRLHACHHCDLLVRLADLEAHDHARCPRCGTLLARHRPNSLDRTQALSLTGLLVFFPAAALPVIRIDLLGQANANTLVNGVLRLAEGGYWWMALLVAICSLIVPFSLLALLNAVCLLSRLRRGAGLQIRLLRAHHHLKHWGMLDVYMLSLLVAIIKMRELGDLHLGPGLYAFVALLLATTLAQTQFDSRECWQRLEAAR